MLEITWRCVNWHSLLYSTLSALFKWHYVIFTVKTKLQCGWMRPCMCPQVCMRDIVTQSHLWELVLWSLDFLHHRSQFAPSLCTECQRRGSQTSPFFRRLSPSLRSSSIGHRWRRGSGQTDYRPYLHSRTQPQNPYLSDRLQVSRSLFRVLNGDVCVIWIWLHLASKNNVYQRKLFAYNNTIIILELYYVHSYSTFSI